MKSVRRGSSAPTASPSLAGPRSESGDRFRVVIAGGEVAGLEALLALRQLVPDRVAITLVAPTREFTYRPLSVAEPFERSRPRAFAVDQIALENHSAFRRAGVASIDEHRRKVTLTDGATVDYDALLLAIGADAAEAVAGAITFGGSPDARRVREVVDELERGEVKRVAFAIPQDTWWPIGAYELALQTAHRLRESGVAAELRIVTAEKGPLALFGDRASGVLARLLDEAGIAVTTGVRVLDFDGERLSLGDAEAIECDRVIALPVPDVPRIPGLRGQQHRGLIATDRFGGVLGMERVFAAGDATWFPIKQGGIAAQQADAAATAIATLADARVDPQPFRPVLRGALLTGEGPLYMRADAFGGHHSFAARSILWWPPAKIAGRLLAPYLAAKAGYRRGSGDDLADLAPPIGADPVPPPDNDDVVALAFASADADARLEDYRGAMRWLEVAEDLELHLPTDYELKRISWQELAKARS
jgi:sulfide:quinone oxidoreductase